MKTWIYSWIVYPLAFAVAQVLGLFNKKIRDTLRLRAWKDFLSLRMHAGSAIEYWIHVASAGELEYAIPVIRALDEKKKKVLVTYYSVSAKNAVETLAQSSSNVSLVVPLPHDGLGLMREFVELVWRQGVRNLLLMKYELWPGLLWECNRRGIKVVLVDALKPGWLHRRLLHKLDGIYAGYESELDGVEHERVAVLGDTRVERVLERVANAEEKLSSVVSPELKAKMSSELTLVCGSMWPKDTNTLVEALSVAKKNGRPLMNLIWVPHEIDEKQGDDVRRKLKALGYDFCELNSMQLPVTATAAIVLKKGILAELYRLGAAAYVGGGHGDGVHSVWEPALCGIPVACAGRIERSPESTELQIAGILTVANTPEELLHWFEREGLFSIEQSKQVRARNGIKAIQARHVGAARRVIEICEAAVLGRTV